MKKWLVVSMVFVLMACVFLPQPPGQRAPSPTPLELENSKTPSSPTLNTLRPTLPAATATVKPVQNSPQPRPVLSPAPALTQEVISILQPGPSSALTSPVRVNGEADPTFEQNLVVQVVDSAGKTIAETATHIQADVGKRGAFQAEVPFQVNADQAGRVAVMDFSAKDGGLIHLSSVEVTLLAKGATQVRPSAQQTENIVILMPAQGSKTSGGKLRVEGRAGQAFENRLMFSLCGETEGGAGDLVCGSTLNVLARGSLSIKASDVGQAGAYQAELSYKVNRLTQARLAIYVTSPRDGKITHLASRPVALEP